MATPRTITFTKEDLASAGSLRDIEPGVYDATLVSVKDHTSKAGNATWKWTFEIEGAGGGTLDVYTSFSDKARWKLLEVFRALGIEVTEGTLSADPDLYTGTVVSAEIAYQDDDEFSAQVEGPRYLEIRRVFKKVEKADIPAPTRTLEFSSLDGSDEFDEDVEGAAF